MYIFLDIGLSLLFTLSLIMIYFLYEKTLTIKIFSFFSIKTYVIDILNGFFYGFVVLLLKYIIKQIDIEFSVPLFFIASLIFLLIKNINISVVVTIPSLIYDSVTSNDFPSMVYLILSLLLIQFTYLIINFFKTREFAEKIMYLTMWLLSIIGMIILGIALKLGFGRSIMEKTIISPFLFIFIYLPMRTSIRFSISANILSESVNYVFSSYVRHPLMQEAIGDNIVKNNVRKAIYGIFEIRFETHPDPNTKKELIETTLSIFERNAPKNSTLFAYDDKKFGFFIPLKLEGFKPKISILGNESKKRKKEDPVNIVEKLMLSLNNKYKTLNEYIMKVSVKAGVSFYGIQANSINDLQRNALQALRDIVWKSTKYVKVFDQNIYKKRNKDSFDLANMDDKLDLSSLENIYYPIYGYKNGNWNYVKVENTSQYEILESLNDYVRINGWKEIFDRYYSIEAINSNKNNFGIFVEYYPFSDSNTKINYIENHLNKMGIDKKKIFFVVSGKDILKNSSFEFINYLINNNFNIAIKDSSKVEKYISNMGIKTIITNTKEKIKKKKGIDYIVVDIDNDHLLQESIENKYKFLAGKEIELSYISKKLDKKSKMYIDSMII